MSVFSLLNLHIWNFCCNFAAKLVKIFDMAKFKQEKIQNFSEFYKKLGKRKRKSRFRDAVCAQTGWAYSTFYAKMKQGNTYTFEAPIVRQVMEQFPIHRSNDNEKAN